MKSIFFSFLVAGFMLFSSCQNSQEHEDDQPILGEWVGEKFYNMKGEDTLSIKENNERFYVTNENIRYSYFGDEDGEIIPYSIANDTITMNGVTFYIIELTENSLVRRYGFSDEKYQIFTCKKVK